MKKLTVRTTPNDLDIFAEIEGDAHIAVYRDSATSTAEIENAVNHADELADALEKLAEIQHVANFHNCTDWHKCNAVTCNIARRALAAYRKEG